MSNRTVWLALLTLSCGNGPDADPPEPLVAGEVQVMAGPQRQSVRALGFAADGALYVAGTFEGTIDLDPGPGVDERASAGRSDVFLIRIEANGRHAWSHTIGGPNQDEVASLAVTPAGGVALTGHYGDRVDFDPGPGEDERFKSGSNGEAYVLVLTAAGQRSFSVSFPGVIEPDASYGARIATTAEGGFLVSGSFRGRLDVDPGPAETLLTAEAGHDGFVVALGPDGERRWAAAFSGPGDENSLAVMASGSVWVAGTHTAGVDLDPTAASALHTAMGRRAGYVARLTHGGAPLGGTGFGGDLVTVHDASASADGGLFVAGEVQGTLELSSPSGMESSAAMATDGFVLHLAPDGGARWVRQLQSAGDDQLRALAPLPDGGVMLAGYAVENAVITNPVAALPVVTSGLQVVIARLSADGRATWALSTPPERATARALAVRGTALIVGGAFEPPFPARPVPGIPVTVDEDAFLREDRLRP